MRLAMSVRMRILFGLAIGALAGFVTGKWGSSGGIAAMLAGVLSVGLAPLAIEWVAKRKAGSASSRPPHASTGN
jgi:hypothetical protein